MNLWPELGSHFGDESGFTSYLAVVVPISLISHTNWRSDTGWPPTLAIVDSANPHAVHDATNASMHCSAIDATVPSSGLTVTARTGSTAMPLRGHFQVGRHILLTRHVSPDRLIYHSTIRRAIV